jgi:hypothetical protein
VGCSIVGLKDRIQEMCPEIERLTMAMDFVLDTEKDASVLTLRREVHELTTHLERRDADDCMSGITCVSPGVLIEKIMANFELRR